ncbi:IS110 family transposase ISPye25 [Brucella sp. NBRC 14130]|uniref:IS110 family transposase n=1 Tax=Brucella sp. NBRC 14130 TaxID=3075483 RepID=UPI000A5155EA
MDYFIGLDVSLASTAICVLNAHGKVVKETKVETEPEALAAFLRSLSGNVIVVGLEAGPLSQWLHKPLTEGGFEMVLMETRQVKGALQAMPIKTDRRDAEGIARLLQMGWFRPVHCKSVSAQEMRALLTARKAIQQSTIDLELSLRGVLRNFGLKIGQVGKGRFEARIRELIEGNPMLEAAANPILRARMELRNELAKLEKQLCDLAKADSVCRLMMSMPGVGAIVALTVRSAIDDPERFRSSKDVGPWAGLTPRRNQSGERDVVGQITLAGDAGLRTALYQAATVMLNRGKPNWLTAWAWKVAQRRGKKRATIGLARRIGVVLHRMWRDGKAFRFTREATTMGAAT